MGDQQLLPRWAEAALAVKGPSLGKMELAGHRPWRLHHYRWVPLNQNKQHLGSNICFFKQANFEFSMQNSIVEVEMCFPHDFEKSGNLNEAGVICICSARERCDGPLPPRVVSCLGFLCAIRNSRLYTSVFNLMNCYFKRKLKKNSVCPAHWPGNIQQKTALNKQA